MTDELTTLRTENAQLKARLAIEWDGVANERDALRKENNELRTKLTETQAELDQADQCGVIIPWPLPAI